MVNFENNYTIEIVSKKRIIKYIAVAAWMLLIFWFSAQGHEASSGQSTGIVQEVHRLTGAELPEMVVRKAAHITLYALYGVLVAMVVLEYTTRWRRAWLWATGIVCAYAISDEIHQLFTGGRSAQVSDVVLDTIAGAVAIGILLVVRRIYLRKYQ